MIMGVYLVAVWVNSDVVKAIFWGIVFHMILDIIFLLKIKSLFSRVFSLIEYIIRKKQMTLNGLSPNRVYDEIIVAVNKRFE